MITFINKKEILTFFATQNSLFVTTPKAHRSVGPAAEINIQWYRNKYKKYFKESTAINNIF